MNRESADPETLRSWRVERRLWWFTVSSADERSNRVMTEDREAALAVWSSSVTVGRAVSVE